MAGPRKPHTRATAERGMGYQHQQQRKRLLAAHIEGTPCPYCGDPMYSDQPLDADHSTPRGHPDYKGALADRLAHQSCNARDGQRLTMDLRRAAAVVCDYHETCGSVHSRHW